jgi:hypothetical protein
MLWLRGALKPGAALTSVAPALIKLDSSSAQRCKTRCTRWLSSTSSFVSNPLEKWTK